MAKVLPTRVKQQVETRGFDLLNEWQYLNRTRVENSQFMDQLVDHPEIGKKLSEFLDRAGVRKYIKDVIVNKYAKLKRKMPRDLGAELESWLGEPVHEIEWVNRDKLSLHRSESGTYLITARTTFIKWETGLRKILLYCADKPNLHSKHDVQKCLAIFEHGATVNQADKNHLQKALDSIGIFCLWGT